MSRAPRDPVSQMPGPWHRPPAFCLSLLGFGLLALACGRPATAPECEEIVERMARLEIQKQRPARAEIVEEEVKAAKERHRKTVSAQCVGKRITDAAMACVRAARSANEVTGCFE